MTAAKQCQLPVGHEEVTAAIGELEKVGIIRAAHSSFSSPMWPIQKPDGTWRMTVDYQELNKVISPICAVVPSVMDLMDLLTDELGTYNFVADLANVFFSVDIAPESQDQFIFTWEGQQWTFTVLSQRYGYSPTICQRLVADDLASVHGPQQCASFITLTIFC